MSSFKAVFNKVLNQGRLSSPRGQKTLEIENALCTFLPYERFAAFPSRKLSLNYIKQELCWYLKGDMYDLSICDHAKIWRSMVTSDGKLNSNYGYSVFTRGGIDYVAECLKKDKDSRRALISILGRSHLFDGNSDVPCTVTLGFRIRDDELGTTVHMRSADIIFGVGNDVPFFSFVAECLLVMLRPAYPGLVLGNLTLFSESLHVYERHFEMLAKLVNEDPAPVDCPRLHSINELKLLRANNATASKQHQFSGWLLRRDKKKEAVA